MSLIYVWVVVAALTMVVFIEYIMVTPIVHQFTQRVNVTSVSGVQAVDSMGRHIEFMGTVLNTVPYIVVGVVLLWAFMHSQRREVYTGV